MSQIRFEEQQYNTESLDAGLWKRLWFRASSWLG